MLRVLTLLAAVLAGLSLSVFMPELPERGRALLTSAGLIGAAPAAKGGHGHGHGHSEGEKEGPEGVVAMTPERIAAAKIETAPVDKGVLSRRLTVPGVIAADADRVARVAARVTGTVSDLNKRLGDIVAKGETVAVLDSREVAEAKSELLTALVNQELQAILFEREQSLWDKKISAEQQYLKARNTYAENQLRVDLARQKLSALGVSEAEVAGVGRQALPFKRVASAAGAPVAAPAPGLQRYELRSPIAGRIVERKVDLGAPVGGEGQEKEIYTIADLSAVWVELAVPTGDLGQIREGQVVTITTGTDGLKAEARIVFVSPMLNQETRSARVIASLANKDLTWRPGSYVTAQIRVSEEPVDLVVPRSALQSIKGEQAVFVRTKDGFEKRDVVLGKGDDATVEVVFGLDPGEQIAVANSFVLKAELGKAEAEHAH